MGAKTPTLHKTKKGLDLPIEGVPLQEIHQGPRATRVALLAGDYPGMRPRMEVAEGDQVKAGQVLFEDRKNPGVFFTSPASGKVHAISRGERRALLSVSVDVAEEDDSQVEYLSYTGKPAAELSSKEVSALLLESGVFTGFKARPFGRVPSPETRPRSMFITAVDTHPLTADPETVLKGKEEDFFAGVVALSKLPERDTFLCLPKGSSLSEKAIGLENVRVHEFHGPHPAGNPGFHMHVLDPVDRGRLSWAMGYQEVAAFGHLLRTGKQTFRRVFALGGPIVNKPRLISTRLGASLKELLQGETEDEKHRVITGSVLGGHNATPPEVAYLGRHHNQVTMLHEGDEREFLGWMIPGVDLFTVTKLFLSSLTSGTKFDLDTSLHGSGRTMIPSGGFDKVMPFDLMPFFLLRAILSGDMERAEALGCLELTEEDVALCSFICPSKIDYGAALRDMLNKIEKEG